MSEGQTLAGRSRTTLIVGLIIAILASSTLSTVIATQWVAIQGPKGDKGEQGPQRPAGVFTVENLSGWLPTPAYDSGWVGIDPAQFLTFSHNLSTAEVFVYLLGRNESGAIHQLTHEMHGVQVSNLDDVNITIWRHGLDRFWYQVRVMIWKISEPPT